MNPRLETGIEILDRRLEGGLPPGSVVALSAPPASQAELLLYELTAAQGSLYLTTERTEQAVKDSLEETAAPSGDPTVRDIPGTEPLDQAGRLFRALPQDSFLIVDTVDPLERCERNRYRTFLNELRTHMVNTDSIAFLHCLDDGRGDAPDSRNTTMHMADIIFDLTLERRGGELNIELAIPKFRGGSALMETIKLELSDRVGIDTSRDIA